MHQDIHIWYFKIKIYVFLPDDFLLNSDRFHDKE